MRLSSLCCLHYQLAAEELLQSPSWACEKADISQLTARSSQGNPTRNCSSPIVLRDSHAPHTGIPQNNACHWTQRT